MRWDTQRPSTDMHQILDMLSFAIPSQKNDYQDRGCDISSDEIFVSDGAKCDCSNIQEIFSLDNKIAVCDPVYPVYVRLQRNGR